MTFPFPAKPPTDFNPRPPRGGRQRRYPEPACEGGISIHAPREGGDWPAAPRCRRRTDFNPRPPRGGRRKKLEVKSVIDQFQSTPPARGATSQKICRLYAKIISIHAPREGGDIGVTMAQDMIRAISIHAPREGGDFQPLKHRTIRADDFNPRPPRGGRLVAWYKRGL